MKQLQIICLLALAYGPLAPAADEPAVQKIVTRAEVEKPWGAYLGIGSPYPSILGVNGAYQFDKHARATIGYGEIETTTSVSLTSEGFTQEKVKAQTYGAGVMFLFFDDGIRPTVGLNAGYFSVKGKGDFNIDGFKSSTALLYSSLGFDWIGGGGMNLGAGVDIALLGGNSQANIYANVGYFF